MDKIVGFLMLCFLGFVFAKGAWDNFAPLIVLFAFFGAMGFGFFWLIRESPRWEREKAQRERERQDQEALDRANRAAQEVEALVDRNIAGGDFLPADDFAQALLKTYQRRCPRPWLLKPLLNRLMGTLVDMYRTEFSKPDDKSPPRARLKYRDPQCAYDLYFSACVEALVEFTKQSDPALLNSASNGAFLNEAISLRDLVIVPAAKEADEDFTDRARTAYRAFLKPFREHQVAFKTLGLLEWQSFLGATLARFCEPEPAYSDDRRRWRERKREHEELRKETARNTPRWQQLFLYTPFEWECLGLIPHSTYLRPFAIPPERWFEGTWIVGAQGRGKSTLLRQLILHHYPNASIIILDAKGDLLNSFRRMAAIRDRLVIIEPDLEHPPALNPLDIGGNAVEFLAYLFELLDTKMTANQTTLFRLVLTLVQQIPNATLETVRDIILNGWEPYEPYVRTLKKIDQDFFDKEFHTKIYSERKPEVLLRLRLLLSNPYLEAMFQAPRTKIDLGALMDEGKIICINNSYHPDKLGEDGAEFFGRVVIALVWAAARRRAALPDSQKRPVFFVIDEAHCVISRDTTIAKIIQQCRSQKIAMIFSHQEVQQIKNEDVKSALTNCAIKFANSTGEAHELAPRLLTTPEMIKAQRRGTFACYVLDTTDSAVSVSVPPVSVRPDHTLVDFPVIPDGEFNALMGIMRAAYCQDTIGDGSHATSVGPRAEDAARVNSAIASGMRARPIGPPPKDDW